MRGGTREGKEGTTVAAAADGTQWIKHKVTSNNQRTSTRIQQCRIERMCEAKRGVGTMI